MVVGAALTAAAALGVAEVAVLLRPKCTVPALAVGPVSPDDAPLKLRMAALIRV